MVESSKRTEKKGDHVVSLLLKLTFTSTSQKKEASGYDLSGLGRVSSQINDLGDLPTRGIIVGTERTV